MNIKKHFSAPTTYDEIEAKQTDLANYFNGEYILFSNTSLYPLLPTPKKMIYESRTK